MTDEKTPPRACDVKFEEILTHHSTGRYFYSSDQGDVMDYVRKEGDASSGNVFITKEEYAALGCPEEIEIISTVRATKR